MEISSTKRIHNGIEIIGKIYANSNKKYIPADFFMEYIHPFISMSVGICS